MYKVRLENGQIIDVSAPNQSRPMSQARGITWEDVVYLSWEPESAMLLNS
ncbi:TOBE domain-containing protein [Amylibacter sp.]|nr:TOBE domain-containing protein [Amylibacter sp.]